MNTVLHCFQNGMLKETIREARQPSKRRKLTKVDEMKTALNDATTTFISYQKEAEQRMLEFEERRLKADRETEDRHRKEDKEHELRMLRLLASMQSGYAAPPTQPMQAVQHPSNLQPRFEYNDGTSSSYFQL